MGMTTRWRETRGQRVRERLERERASTHAYALDVHVILDGLSDLVGMGDRPTVDTARDLADILGMLTPEEYRYLLRRTLEFLQQQISHSASVAEQRLQEGLDRQANSGRHLANGDTLTELRREHEGDTDFIQLALALQALTWAVAPPRPEGGVIA